jgi:hypothetical protein
LLTGEQPADQTGQQWVNNKPDILIGSGFAENAEPLFLISMLPSIIIPLIGTVS